MTVFAVLGLSCGRIGFDSTTCLGPELTWYHDADGDGYTNNADTQLACADPDGAGTAWVATATANDCADVSGSDGACNNLGGASCHPGLAGSDGCDGADNDCDTVIDEDGVCVAGIVVNPVSGLVTAESGATATFDVVLKSAPSAGVTIALSSSNPAEGSVAPTGLTFTTGNWNLAQTVTVTGVDDVVVDGSVAYPRQARGGPLRTPGKLAPPPA